MVFTFRIVSDEVDNFKREIKIDSTATFLDLKNAICDAVGYDKHQLSSFFLCDDDWEKDKEITFEDMDSDMDHDIWLMDDAVLADFIDDEGQKLIYTFDYMTDRSFFMEMTEMAPGKNLMDPLCSLSIGQAPSEIVELDVFDANIDKKNAAAEAAAADFEHDILEGLDPYAYDPEDLDADGFSELNMD